MDADVSAFVGRDAEIDRLDAWSSGRGPAALLLRGEAGIGKTRLVGELIARSQARRGPTVLVGRGAAVAGAAVPFVAFTDLLRTTLAVLPEPDRREAIDDFGDPLRPLLPELGEVPDSDTTAGKPALFDAVVGLFARAAVVKPLVAVFEDAQWMAPSGIELLDFVLRARIRNLRVLLTARDEDLPGAGFLGRLIAEAERGGLLEEVALGPLPDSAVGALAAAILGRAVTDEELVRIHHRSDGNPYFVQELARHELGGRGPLPAHLTDLVTLPLRRLSEDTRTVLQAAAAAGQPVSHADLIAVTGLPFDRFERAARSAIDAHLLVPTEDGRGYAFRHELSREAVYGLLLPAERLRLHSAYADVLSARAMSDRPAELHDLAALANHVQHLGDLNATLHWTLSAAQAAERAYAFHEALDFYRRALALWPADARGAGRRLSVLKDASRVADQIADHAAALRLVQDALDVIDESRDPVTAASFLVRRAWYEYLLFEPIPLQASTHAVDLMRNAPVSRERARVLAVHSRLVAIFDGVEPALRAAEEARRVADSLGAQPEVACALISQGLCLLRSGDMDGGFRTLREACDLAHRIVDVEDVVPAYVLLLENRLLLEPDRTAVVALALDSHERLRRLGIADGHMLLAAAAANAELGRWEDSAEQARSAAWYGSHARPFAELLLDLVRVLRGDGSPQRDHATEASFLARLQPSAAKPYGEWLAELELARSSPFTAADTIKVALSRLMETPLGPLSGSLFGLGMRACADCVIAAADRRDHSARRDAETRAQQLIAWSQSVRPNPFDDAANPAPTAAADAASWIAERSRLHGGSDPDLWRSAASAWDLLARPFQAAYARWRLAEALIADRRRRREATPVLREALALSARLGAQPLQRELQRLADRAHLPLDTTEPEPSASSGRQAPVLTSRETDVLRLIQQGLSTRAIAQTLRLSPKTVDTHVSHLLIKLDAHDRLEAVARAQRLGLMP